MHSTPVTSTTNADVAVSPPSVPVATATTFELRRATGSPIEQAPGAGELQQKFDELQAIYRMSNAVVHAGALEEIYDVALDELQRTVHADRAAVLLYDDERVMRFKAWRRLSESYRRAVEGHSPWSPDERDPQPVLVS